jgi:pimeloyl-ACP methyl ester carboxylesterase
LEKEGTLTQMIPGMTRRDEARPVLAKYVLESNPQTVANAFHELFITDLRPELPRITVPVTVLYVVPQEAPMPPDQFEGGLRQMYSTAPRVQLVRIDDSNHYIQIDQPARFVAEVDAFMKR